MALGPPGQASFDGAPLRLGWAVIDAGWAYGQAELLGGLRAHGVRLLFDTGSFRYREPGPFLVPKHRDAPWAPASVLHDGDLVTVREFVRRDLRAQADLGADAYLVPGFVPRDRTDDVSLLSMAAVEEAVGFAELPAKPLVGFLGVHPSNVVAGRRLLDRLPSSLAGLFVQFSKVDPYRDSASRLETVARFLLDCEAAGFPTLAGRLGALGPMLAAFGVSAAEAGLGEGETFTLAQQVRPPNQDPSKSSGPRMGRSLFVSQIGRSLPARTWLRLLEVDALRGSLRCGLACCRWSAIDTIGARAVEHSLRWRCADVAMVEATAGPLRIQLVLDRVAQQRAVLNACNRALVELNEKPISTAHLDHQLTAAIRLAGHPEAA
ncbi:MAG: hypothetical protein ACYCTI_00490 [Acidimicrobiales bacterium]